MLFISSNCIYFLQKLFPKMSLTAVAIVNSENLPILIKTKHPLTDHETISSLFHLHAALDIFEEKRNLRDSFIGLLTQTEAHKIYGFTSTTNTKILIMVSSPTLRDNEARSMLKTIHNAYIESTAGNPFYNYGEPIKSRLVHQNFILVF